MIPTPDRLSTEGMRRQRYNQAHWTLQRERLQLPDWTPPNPEPEKSALKEFIPDALRSLGLKDPGMLHAIEQCWAEVAGENIAQNCHPVRFDQGVLLLFASHPIWISEFQEQFKGEILARLRARLGLRKIRDIRIQLDPCDS